LSSWMCLDERRRLRMPSDRDWCEYAQMKSTAA
jgi:hypothetical protein